MTGLRDVASAAVLFFFVQWVGWAGPIIERPSEKLRRLGVSTKIRRGGR